MTGTRQRYGQWVFNDAYRAAPELVNRLRDTDVDPFYQDERVERFIAALVDQARAEGRQRPDPGSTALHALAVEWQRVADDNLSSEQRRIDFGIAARQLRHVLDQSTSDGGDYGDSLPCGCG